MVYIINAIFWQLLIPPIGYCTTNIVKYITTIAIGINIINILSNDAD